MNEKTRMAYQRWAISYDSDDNPQTKLEFYPVLNAVAAKSGERILDAGCGTGRYSLALAQVGAEVTGIDFSMAMLELAKKKVPEARFLPANLSKRLPFEDDSFDKIICAQVLKHLPKLNSTFCEFARVLRSAGHLVFSVTHPDMNWEGYEMRAQPDFVLSQETDIYHHALSDYEAALGSAGFNKINCYPVPVSKVIANLLTRRSFEIVEGRPQILICSASKSEACTADAKEG